MSEKPTPPLLGDGSIVGDYTLLYRYWDELRRRGRNLDNALLRREDFEKLRRLVEEHTSMTLEKLLSILTEEFLPRVDREAAMAAARATYGVELDAETAARRVARILAGWLIEAGKQSGILRLRGPSLPTD
ncbi:hypothetical protein Pyrfu_1631 [Pyrolobus fumarii 1A]|uniref:Uncharacterized protein n=1 Tax=Pyrolobus fumarii (strain DSM 11204 / 1A) TaxID=694429 RepID=G0ECB8_PYRF1|nr:hypothetical protein [Pyrolobus fumarii]AEM39488.1 hypothetical protein Pyrfu_1631 [Pyrolobus fumarii 1A]